MTLELGLLILESVLLLATVILLITSIREGRSRDSLIGELGKATRILTRHEYFITVTDTMTDAKREVVGCITGRLPVGEDIIRTREVVEKIRRLASAGVKVKYVVPKFQDRLHVGWRYTRAGAEVRYNSRPLVYDFRYTVVDDNMVVIGIPEAVGEKEATKKGYRIPSEGLGFILRDHFYGCWDNNLTYEEYLLETLKQTGATPEVLARELQIDEAELKRVASRPPS